MKKFTWRKAAAAALACFAATTAVHAQDGGVEEEDFGGGRVTGKLELLTTYSDNFYYQPDGAETDALGLRLIPSLGFRKQGKQVSVRSTLSADAAVYDVDGDEDDYRDGRAEVIATLKPSVRNEFELSLDARRGHDPFGFDRTEGAPSIQSRELDQWSDYSGRLRYSLGAPAAPLGAELSASGMRRTYLTNEAQTGFLDRRATEGEVLLRFRVQPRTSLIANAILTRYDFDQRFGPGDLRNGELRRARLGVQWVATAKTTGDIRVGYRERTFDDSTRQINSSDWAAGVTWAPRRLNVEIRSGRDEQASYLNGVQLIDVRYVSARGTYQWSPRLDTTLGFKKAKADFVGQPREDDYRNFSAEASWRASSKATLLANAATSERESGASGRDFGRFTSYLGVRLEL